MKLSNLDIFYKGRKLITEQTVSKILGIKRDTLRKKRNYYEIRQRENEYKYKYVKINTSGKCLILYFADQFKEYKV